jgi:rSAM/selenodomain-associated transferase 1
MFSSVSIIIPLANSEISSKELVATLPPEAEVILCSEGTRAKSMNTGARKATREFLWFLHVDSLLTNECLPALHTALESSPKDLLFFGLAFDKSNVPMGINCAGLKVRADIVKLPFGDQGFCMHRELFKRLGTYDETLSYGEDHMLVWKAHQLGVNVKKIDAKIFTSPCKYTQNGWLKTTLKHQYLFWKQAIPAGWKLITKLPPANIAIVVFVKTPGFSPIKTRLAVTIGKDKAEEFYNLSIKATEATVTKTQANHYWAVAEHECLNEKLWKNFNVIQSGEGGLGERLHHVYSTLLTTHDAVILLGADCPHMPTSAINIAIKKLKQSPYILGPAVDGGFYLFAGREPISEEVWTSTTYSAETTMSELTEKLDYENIDTISTLTDVDDIETLQALDTHLHIQLDHSKELLEIKNWIAESI